ncbi:MAG TPA: SRPBCC domain-containing protein [Spirochaetia bacterium]|nr:SRPBCC domain-containing protein [Spirochaetia bacterium]
MTPGVKTIEVKLARAIPAPPAEVFDRWLDPACPGTPWSEAEKLILDPRVDGLFFFRSRKKAGEGKPHYGRFTVMDRPSKVQYTWMSPNTNGLESVVTVTFQESGGDTLLTLRHGNLPDDEHGRTHQAGWEHFLGRLAAAFSAAS